MIGSILGGAQMLGGLLGGGGPRAPRMSRAQKQQMQQQAQQQQALQQHMMQGCHRVNQCSHSFFGRPCHNHCCGSIASAGMHGACHHSHGSMGCRNHMDSLFQPPFGPNFGGGLPFQPPTVVFAMGFNMSA